MNRDEGTLTDSSLEEEAATILGAQRAALTRHQTCCVLSLNTSAFRTVRNKYLLFINYPIYGNIMAAPRDSNRLLSGQRSIVTGSQLIFSPLGSVTIMHIASPSSFRMTVLTLGNINRAYEHWLKKLKCSFF